jgi:hypothetical protein
MSTYFPFLRGKREELFALRALADEIAESGSIIPIIEPVNGNDNTMRSFSQYTEAGMHFILVTNPKHGDYRGREQALHDHLCVNGPLTEYDNFVPALYIRRETVIAEVDNFNELHNDGLRAVIYDGEPISDNVSHWCSTEGRIYYHIILEGKVNAGFIQGIPAARQVLIRDNFKRKIPNSQYPEREHFTDLNTIAGNPNNLNWGDYSIQGDHFSEGGGAAMTVAIHHIHYADNTESLDISHFLSDRQETTDDPAGKTIEAARKLVDSFDNLAPNDTEACDEYRQMVESETWRGLGYLKRLAIRHHLEVILRHA